MRKILLLIISLYIYYINQSMFLALGDEIEAGSASAKYMAITMILIIVISAIVVFPHIFKKMDTYFSKFFFWWMILGLINLTITFDSPFTLNHIILNSLFFVLQYFLFLSFYWIFYNDNIDSFFYKIIVLCTLIISFFYYQTYSIIQALFDTQVNTSYFPLYLTPFVLCIPNKFWRLSLVAIMCIIVFSSLKRGGLIALTLALFVYYWVDTFCKNESINLFKSALLAMLILAVLAIGAITLDNAMNKDVLIGRLQETKEDGGSGRDEIYDYFISKIRNSSTSELLYGRGFEATKFKNVGIRTGHRTISYTAHNDVLEVIYDFGLVMFFLYLSFWIAYISYAIKLVKQKSNLAAPFAASFALFLILSLISHIIIYPHIVTISMFLGMATGINKRELTINEVNTE